MPKKKKSEPVNVVSTYVRHTQNLTAETGLRLLAQAIDKLADDHGIDWDEIGEIHIWGPSRTRGQTHKNDWIIVIHSKDAKGFRVGRI